MSVRVKIPTQLRPLAGGQPEIEVEGADSLRELLTKMGAGHPKLVERVLDEEGELRRFVNVYVGDEDVRFLEGLDTTLDESQVVSILPAVAGGAAEASVQGVFNAFRGALEAHDYDAMSELYADDATYTMYSERNRPSSAKKVEGGGGIKALFQGEAPNLEHRVVDEVVGEDRFAYTLICKYPTGELVFGTAVCDVRDGKITRHAGVEAWDL
jgi:molybdopterin synthase sulfur carrier subunit